MWGPLHLRFVWDPLDLRWLVERCFTSTETVGLLGMGAQDGHLDFHAAPELCLMFSVGPNTYSVGLSILVLSVGPSRLMRSVGPSILALSVGPTRLTLSLGLSRLMFCVGPSILVPSCETL